jgi:hypothetical protein
MFYFTVPLQLKAISFLCNDEILLFKLRNSSSSRKVQIITLESTHEIKECKQKCHGDSDQLRDIAD